MTRPTPAPSTADPRVGERTLSGRICLADGTRDREAVFAGCPGPYTSPRDKTGALGLVLHCDGETVWGTHDACGRRFEVDQIDPTGSIDAALFDLIHAQAESGTYNCAGPLHRRQEIPLCVPRLLGRREHQHLVGHLPELRRYAMESSMTGYWYTASCPKCKAESGFLGERDPHRWRIWCGRCGHNWTEGHDPEYSLTQSLAHHREVVGEQAAEAAVLDLLRG
jgi:ribosomal protein S27AE